MYYNSKSIQYRQIYQLQFLPGAPHGVTMFINQCNVKYASIL